MARVRELRVRSDWQLIRFVYLPVVAIGVMPIDPCGICVFCKWWGHHLEEWIRRKPLFRITDAGLCYEDGGAPIDFAWSEITGVVLHRRNTIPLWRTNGSLGIATPRFWLAIDVRQEGRGERTICIWPRQVVGGLSALIRFARELQRQLLALADDGEIPLLLPRAARNAG